ncbi:MAG: hypothetical protein HY556_02035 [Euryarchaeota archaeon]|nr:hypothetical protein [Euryarchaeota archaeon]
MDPALKDLPDVAPKLAQFVAETAARPQSTEHLTGLLRALERPMETGGAHGVAGKAYLMGLFADRAIEGLIEEDYVPHRDLREFFQALGANYNRLITNDWELPLEWTELLESYQNALMAADKIDKRTLQTFDYMVPISHHDSVAVKVYLAPITGPFKVSGYSYPYYLDLDSALADPKKIEAVVDAYVWKLRLLEEKMTAENGEKIDKICMIAKRKGPVGALSLASHIAAKFERPAMVFREREVERPHKLQGAPLEPGDQIAIVYDLSVGGGGIESAAEYLVAEEPTCRVRGAVVLCDYGHRAKSRLKAKNIDLNAIATLTPDDYRAIREPQLKREAEGLDQALHDGRLTEQEYFERRGALKNDFADLAWLKLCPTYDSAQSTE